MTQQGDLVPFNILLLPFLDYEPHELRIECASEYFTKKVIGRVISNLIISGKYEIISTGKEPSSAEVLPVPWSYVR